VEAVTCRAPDAPERDPLDACVVSRREVRGVRLCGPKRRNDSLPDPLLPDRQRRAIQQARHRVKVVQNLDKEIIKRTIEVFMLVFPVGMGAKDESKDGVLKRLECED
jgi:hypothetical protein